MPDASHSSPDALQAEWETQITAAKQRVTAPRRTIIRAILAIPASFNAEELLAVARREDALISLATVYRTITLLLDCGLIRKADGDFEKQRYEQGSPVDTRAYVECGDCGRTVPIEDHQCVNLRERFLVKQRGFSMKNMTLRIRANCDAAAEGQCEHRDSTNKEGGK